MASRRANLGGPPAISRLSLATQADASASPARTLHAEHAVDILQRLDDLLQVREVVDLDGHVEARAATFVGVRLHVPDVRIEIRNLRADRGKQPLAILDLHRQLDRVARGGVGAWRLVPFDVDAPLRVVQQVHDVGARRRVDRHALASRDVTDDLLAADGIAAAGPEDHEIVEPADLDLLLAGAKHTPDHGRYRAVWRLLPQLVVGDELDEHLPRLEFAVANRCKQIVGFLRAEFRE